MYQYHMRETVDPMNPYASLYYGTMELKIRMGSRERRMLVYIPDGARESTAGIFILGPDGLTADEVMEKYPWRALADQAPEREKPVIFFLEPENGAWDLKESYGTPDGDAAYAAAAVLEASERYYFRIHETAFYLVGYGSGGVIAQMTAANDPAYYAGVVSIGAPDVPEDWFAACGSDWCLNLDGFEDPDHRIGLKKGEIPLPAWIISEAEQENSTAEEAADTEGFACGLQEENRALAYWTKACGTDSEPHIVCREYLEYRRTQKTPFPLNQEKEAYRVRASVRRHAAEDTSLSGIETIWYTFLSMQRRWMSCPGGDLRVYRDPVRDLGMIYHYETIGGWKREWYIYVPEKVRENPGVRVPLVFAQHGYSCDGAIYAGNSEWWRVADKYGLIIVFPSAVPMRVNMPESDLLPGYMPLPAWNIFQDPERPDELLFFNTLLDRMLKEYPVDEDRVFATGHSWGSLMTQMLGLGMTDRLAGIAPCSGVFFGGALDDMTPANNLHRFDNIQLPVWMHWGLNEEWLIPPVPTHHNETGRTIELWLRRNGKEDMIPEDWEDVPADADGRFLDHRMEREGTAPVWYTQIESFPHGTMPEMSFRIWEAFFSKLPR